MSTAAAQSLRRRTNGSTVATLSTGEAIRRARERLRLTQADVGRRAGYSQMWISHAERGRPMTPAFWARVSEALVLELERQSCAK